MLALMLNEYPGLDHDCPQQRIVFYPIAGLYICRTVNQAGIHPFFHAGLIIGGDARANINQVELWGDADYITPGKKSLQL